jgi:hypothetical protein
VRLSSAASDGYITHIQDAALQNLAECGKHVEARGSVLECACPLALSTKLTINQIQDAALQNLAEFVNAFEARGSVLECACPLALSTKLTINQIQVPPSGLWQHALTSGYKKDEKHSLQPFQKNP